MKSMSKLLEVDAMTNAADNPFFDPVAFAYVGADRGAVIGSLVWYVPLPCPLPRSPLARATWWTGNLLCDHSSFRIFFSTSLRFHVGLLDNLTRFRC